MGNEFPKGIEPRIRSERGLITDVKQPWSLAPDEIISSLQGSREGLTTSSAKQRQLEFGTNTLATRNREPWYMLFLMQFANPLVYILLAAAGIKAYFKGPIDAAVIGGVLLFMDKTGTLTLNQMTVREIWSCGNLYTVGGSGYEPYGDFLCNETPIAQEGNSDLRRLLRIVTLCNDALLSKNNSEWGILGDPTEGALLAVAAKAGIYKADIERAQPRLDEIPFDGEKQFMATLHAEDGQRTAFVAPAVSMPGLRLCTSCVLSICTSMMVMLPP